VLAKANTRFSFSLSHLRESAGEVLAIAYSAAAARRLTPWPNSLNPWCLPELAQPLR